MLNHSSVVGDLIARLQRDYGTFEAGEWKRFLRAIGLGVEFQTLPKRLPAMLCDDTVVINPTVVVDDGDMAWWAFHEAGHWLLHEAGRDEWKAIDGGDIVIGKFERQVNEFAARYPAWKSVPPCAVKHAGLFVFVDESGEVVFVSL